MQGREVDLDEPLTAGEAAQQLPGHAREGEDLFVVLIGHRANTGRRGLSYAPFAASIVGNPPDVQGGAPPRPGAGLMSPVGAPESGGYDERRPGASLLRRTPRGRGPGRLRGCRKPRIKNGSQRKQAPTISLYGRGSRPVVRRISSSPKTNQSLIRSVMATLDAEGSEIVAVDGEDRPQVVAFRHGDEGGLTRSIDSHWRHALCRHYSVPQLPSGQ